MIETTLNGASILFPIPGLEGVPPEGRYFEGYDVDIDEDEDGGTYTDTLTATIVDRRHDMRYIYESSRTSTVQSDYDAIGQWHGLDVPLKEIQRRTTGQQWETLVEGSYIVDPNSERQVPDEWCTAGTSMCLTFAYDEETGALESVSNGEETLALAYEEFPYDSEDPYSPTFTRLTSVASSCETCPEFTYEYEAGLLTAVKNCTGDTIEGFEYDEAGRVTKRFMQEDGEDEQLVFEAAYDDEEHTVTKFVYQTNTRYEVRIDHLDEATGRVTKTKLFQGVNPPDLEAAAPEVIYDYDYEEVSSVMRLATLAIESPSGLRSVTEYDTSGWEYYQPIERRLEFEELSVVLGEWSYNAEGFRILPIEHAGIRGEETVTYYDSFGLGLPIYEIQPVAELVLGGEVGVIVEHDYDEAGHLRRTDRSLDVEGEFELTPVMATAYDYDIVGNLEEMVEDPDGTTSPTTFYDHDQSNRVILVTEPNGVQRVTKYTEGGAVEREYVLPPSETSAISLTVYQYDSCGRLVKRRVADQPGLIASPDTYNSTFVDTSYGYDAFGRRTSVTVDPAGLALTTTYEYDNQGRMTKTTTPGGIYTITERDGRGRRSRQAVGFVGGTSEDERETLYEYDGDDRLEKVTRPDGSAMVYTYNDFGLLMKEEHVAAP